MKETQNKKGIVLMLICAAMWSTAGLIFKFINLSENGLYNGLAVAGMRSLFAAFAMYAGMKILRKKVIFSKQSFACGLLAAATFICFVVSNQFTSAANAIVLQFTGPIFIIIESYVFLHRKATRLDIVTSVITFLGVGLFVIDGISGGSVLGNIVALFSGLFFGSTFLFVGEGDSETRMSALLIGHIITAVAGLPFLAFAQNGVSATNLLLLIFLGVFQLGIPYLLFTIASGYCSALSLSLLSVVEPLLNPVWVAIFYGEMPSLTAFVGAVIVLGAVTARSVILSKK